MNETKKKGWIKNALIVFLALLLVFTLFSNTFMNRSLPEVSVQYAEGGSISTQISLSGSVISGGTRTVKSEEARTVKEVLVRRGEKVVRGQILATFVPGEETDTFNLEMELKQLEYAYKQMLSNNSTSFVAQERIIADAQDAIAEIDAYIEALPGYLTAKEASRLALKANEDAIEVKTGSIDAVTEQIAELEEKLAKLHDPGTRSTGELRQMIDDARDHVADLEDMLTAADKNKSTLEKAYNSIRSKTTTLTSPETAYNSAVTAEGKAKTSMETAEAAEEKAREEKKTAEADESAKKGAYESLVSALPDDRDPTAEEQAAVDAAKTAYDKAAAEADKARTAYDKAVDKADTARAAYVKAQKATADAKAAVEKAEENLGGQSLDGAFGAYNSAVSQANSIRSQLRTAETELNNLNDGFSYIAFTEQKSDLANSQKALQKELTALQKETPKLQKELDEASEKIGKTEKEANRERLSYTRQIEDAQAEIDRTTSGKAEEDEKLAMDLELKAMEITRKKKEIADAKRKKEVNEVKAPTDGEISSVFVAAGDRLDIDTAVCEITVTEAVGTMECSVTNAQAARLYVGQEAKVQYYYWGSAPVVTVSQIRSDPQSGGKNKLVTFTVDGDVDAGRELHLQVGGQSSSYDTIVPNSAIREDSNGKFILLVISKDSPLGNRYYAERRDVNVLASDATRSAIDASLGWGDYVITKASVPIEDGQQVRLPQ